MKKLGIQEAAIVVAVAHLAACAAETTTSDRERNVTTEDEAVTTDPCAKDSDKDSSPESRPDRQEKTLRVVNSVVRPSECTQAGAVGGSVVRPD